MKRRILLLLSSLLLASQSFAATIVNQAVPAAGTYTFDILNSTVRVDNYVAIQSNLTYGAGGTSIRVYLQTTQDDGSTWQDTVNQTFLLASARKTSAVNKYVAAAPSVAASDGALADDSVSNGFVGRKWRVKIVVVGAYTTSNIRVDVDLHE